MLKSLIIAFSMYSRIPMPKVEWDDKSMRYSLCFFPFVGAVIGLCSTGCFYGMRALGMGNMAVSAVLTVLPIVINGGIHMDGFLDTMDARSSYKSQEEKLEILKDPHTGAFAIIYGIVYLILMYGLFSEVTEAEIGWIAAGYVYSRILSGLSIVTLRKAKKEGMAAVSAKTAQKSVKWILGVELIVCVAFLLYGNPLKGAVCILAGGMAFFYYYRMSYRNFGGITGDLAGFFLQVCEMMILFSVVLVQKAMSINMI